MQYILIQMQGNHAYNRQVKKKKEKTAIFTRSNLPVQYKMFMVYPEWLETDLTKLMID